MLSKLEECIPQTDSRCPLRDAGPRHSARAAAQFSLKRGRLERLRSALTWMVTEAWTDANFCRLRMRRNRRMARYGHQNASH